MGDSNKERGWEALWQAPMVRRRKTRQYVSFFELRPERDKEHGWEALWQGLMVRRRKTRQ